MLVWDCEALSNFGVSEFGSFFGLLIFKFIGIGKSTPIKIASPSLKDGKKDKTYFVHCASGYRSMIFISTLRARGYENLIDVQGGFKAIKESEKFKLSEYVCPTTLL